MKIGMTVVFLSLAIIAALTLTINPAIAHSFNVALVIPLSNTASAQGREILDGFMLVTAERDSHPGQESDGHLGGLDVYVTVVDEKGELASDIKHIARQGEVDIVAAFGSEATLSLVGKLLDLSKVALLLPGQSPFSKSNLPAVAVLISAYEREYGGTPSSYAAQGYNVARRIDAAVRAQSGVDDTASLHRIFRETAQGFAW